MLRFFAQFIIHSIANARHVRRHHRPAKPSFQCKPWKSHVAPAAWLWVRTVRLSPLSSASPGRAMWPSQMPGGNRQLAQLHGCGCGRYIIIVAHHHPNLQSIFFSLVFAMAIVQQGSSVLVRVLRAWLIFLHSSSFIPSPMHVMCVVIIVRLSPLSSASPGRAMWLRLHGCGCGPSG